MRILLHDGSYFARTTYLSYQKARGDRKPGKEHLFSAFVNRLFSVTRPQNLGPHRVIVVLRSLSEEMDSYFQAQQLALPAKLRPFGINVIQLPGKDNINTLATLANSPEFQSQGITIGSDHDCFLGYLTASTWILRHDKVKALRRDSLDKLLAVDPTVLPLPEEWAAFAALREMPRVGLATAIKQLSQLRPLKLFTGYGQDITGLSARFYATAPALAKKYPATFWDDFQRAWQTVFPIADAKVADYTLPRPIRDTVVADLSYYSLPQLAHYTQTTDWADGILQL